VIAVDNASPDESVQVLRRELPDAKLVSLGENRGFAAGVNAATRQASGRYWLLLNPDVRAPECGLEDLVDWMDRHPQVGIASPDIVSVDGRWESPGRVTPSLSRTLLELSRLHKVLPRELRARVLRGPYWTDGDQLDAGWVPGTAMIVRATAALEVGKLREDLFMYGEDLEWCWRMRRCGWRIGVCSTTRFVHATSSSARLTFGEAEKERRIAAGIDAASRMIYGSARARALASVTALALFLEAHNSGSDVGRREQLRAVSEIWWCLATRRRATQPSQVTADY
jgi:GT2 family glycosyltransferase